MTRLHAYADRGREGLKVNPQKLAVVRDQLEQYAQAGLLVSDVDLIERCRQAVIERSPARISVIGVTIRETPASKSAIRQCSKLFGANIRFRLATQTGFSATSLENFLKYDPILSK